MNNLAEIRREFREQRRGQNFFPFFTPTAHRFLPFCKATDLLLAKGSVDLFALLTRLNSAGEFFKRHPKLEGVFVRFCRKVIEGRIDIDAFEFSRRMRQP